ncbi:glutamate 5-kinase [Ktedonobacter sp. SOSP1-85]|uniref:glutamate 5-kinase n=1 Tax=Ktedonobacter sp. SOSP1-85 TaxID=2778367 RepID=UPI001914FB6A|nr:glutamate 5-kinase [Ktedonobacter sp. SOSP1-85]
MAGRQHRIVVKIGGSILTSASYMLRMERLQSLVDDIARLRSSGFTPLIVSSGAVPAGFGALSGTRYPTSVAEKQMAASVGQGRLMHLYQQLFMLYDLLTGQLLLTSDDFRVRARYVNICNTLNLLLQRGVVPIVNENDTVSVDGIKVGDNDTLGALVATAVDAEHYIILSDIDGLYTANPRQDPQARLITTVETITPYIETLGGARGSLGTTGGMRTKIKAARIATAAGVEVVIANGETPDILQRILSGEEIGTHFKPRKRPLSGKKSWIAFGSHPEGKILIDMGAAQAVLHQHKSLLASGILRIDGDFSEGDVVAICGPDGSELGRGISQYASDDLQRLKGMRSQEIASLALANMTTVPEVIHRDTLALYRSTIVAAAQ